MFILIIEFKEIVVRAVHFAQNRSPKAVGFLAVIFSDLAFFRMSDDHVAAVQNKFVVRFSCLDGFLSNILNLIQNNIHSHDAFIVGKSF